MVSGHFHLCQSVGVSLGVTCDEAFEACQQVKLSKRVNVQMFTWVFVSPWAIRFINSCVLQASGKGVHVE